MIYHQVYEKLPTSHNGKNFQYPHRENNIRRLFFGEVKNFSSGAKGVTASRDRKIIVFAEDIF